MDDDSVYAAHKSWPPHLLSPERFFDEGGLRLYRPWQGDGIAINALGLRTESPQPKRPGEWRIAVTGGSTVWGSFVRDADSIPVQLGRALRERGYKNITVYNFGIEGATLAGELRSLERFRDAYALDQVLFYTGGNDALFTYFGRHPSRVAWTGVASLELVKTASRLAARLRAAEPTLDAESRARMRESNRLGNAMIAADEYCRAQNLRCDFVLQPWLLSRAHPIGSEGALSRSVRENWPGLAELWDDMYASALRAGPADHTYDLRKLLDDVPTQVFGNTIHMNEAGNKAIARGLAPIAARAIR